MDGIITILSIIFTFFSGLLISAFNKDRKVHKFILAGILLIFSWYNFIYCSVLNSWIVHFPYLLRIGNPFYYAAPPLCYLYIKYSIYKEGRLSKRDHLHFIPSLIVLADVVYYYYKDYGLIASNAYQIVNQVNEGYKVAVGFIPGPVHLVLKAVQGVIYVSLTWYLLFTSGRKHAIKDPEGVKSRWLFIFGVFVTAIYALITYNTGYHFFNPDPTKFGQLNPLFISRLLLLMMVVLLFFNPSVLYSSALNIQPQQAEPVPVNSAKDIEESESTARTSGISDAKLEEFIMRIEDLILDQEFFKSNITIAELADHLKIPARSLTYILNRHYQMRFNDFINGYRIRYIIRQFEAGYLRELTMEAIAYEAGFASRTTFFMAFKKYTGENPSAYLRNTGLVFQ